MSDTAWITVVAGVNGAGKSSVVGELLREGGDYFNPDEETKRLLKSSASMTPGEANVRAWLTGKRGLEAAIERGSDFTFETTLGGNTIAELIHGALDAERQVAMVYVGLDRIERHLARVRSRVDAGGHDIPEAKIRQRYVDSVKNLLSLAPRLTELRVLDNSGEADPKTGLTPAPRTLLHAQNGRIISHALFEEIPEWAKPIFAVLTTTAAT